MLVIITLQNINWSQSFEQATSTGEITKAALSFLLRFALK